MGNIQLDDMLRARQEIIAEQVEKLLEVFADWREGGFILFTTATRTCRQAPPRVVANYRFLLEYNKKMR